MEAHTCIKLLATINLMITLLPAKSIAQEATTLQNNVTKKGSWLTAMDKHLLIGFSVGWAAKNWTTTLNSSTVREDMWGNPNKMLHGIQFGAHVQQSLYYGLGYRVGLYYEWYISADKFLKKKGWDRFNEHSLYIPLHAAWCLPVTNKLSLSPFGGIGFNWAMYGNTKNGPLSDPKGNNEATRTHYDVALFNYNNHSPHHWNVQAEVGIALRNDEFELSFTYSRGLNHHRIYDEAPSYQNKFAVNVGIVLNKSTKTKNQQANRKSE